MNRIQKRLISFLSLVCALVLLFSSFPLSARAESFLAMVTSSKMKVYKTQSMQKQIGTLSKYDVVTVLSYSGKTACIQKAQNVGYAYISDMASLEDLAIPAYINKNTRVYARATTSSQSISVKKGMRVNLIAINGRWTMLENAGMIAFCPVQYVTEVLTGGTVINETFPAIVTASRVTVYASPSRTSTNLGSMSKNTLCTVHAYNSVWAYVSLNGRYGYCDRTALSKYSASSPDTTETPKPSNGVIYEEFQASVKSKSVKVYASASTSSKYLGTIYTGTVVTVHAYNNTWAQISLNGSTGYCKHSNLKRLYAPAITPTPAPTAAPASTSTPKPTATPSPAPTKVLPKDQGQIFNGDYSNEEKIFLFFTEIAGYSDAAACGILANMKKESGFRPNAVNSTGNYHGLCQWSNGRFAVLQNYCEKNGYEPYSLEGQLNFMMYELSTLSPVYGRNLRACENTAQGAYDAGYYFCYNYERPSNKAVKADERGTLARDTYWEKYN